MFGFIADILTSVTSILLPVFFSYKALRTSDPAVLTPWLMYWTTISLFLVAEAQLNFILSWVPFYSWMRLGLHLYLVLPGQQGSVFIYKEYIHPFLEEHERQIDRMISEGHSKAKAAGIDAVKSLIEYVRVNLLGMPPRPPTPPPSRNVSYTTQLFNRFAMPSARDGFASSVAGSADLFGLIGKALQQTTYPDSTSRDAKARDISASGTLIPPHLTGDERADFVATQREQLKTLLAAFDTEAAYDAGISSGADRHRQSSHSPRHPSSRKPYLAPPESGMHHSRSESEFEDLGYETMPDPEQYRTREWDDEDEPRRRSGGGAASRKSGSGWSEYIWGNYGERDSAVDRKKDL